MDARWIERVTYDIANRYGVDRDAILKEVSRRNPGLLLDGYHADVLVVGAFAALTYEDMDCGAVFDRIDGIIKVAYAGVI